MASSREPSPDWIHNFQAPTFITLSSPSESAEDSPIRRSVPCLEEEVELSRPEAHERDQDAISVDSEEEAPETKVPVSKGLKSKKRTNNHKIQEEDEGEGGLNNADEDIPEKQNEHRVSSRLPLVFPEKIQRSKVAYCSYMQLQVNALIECEGEALDMSGDVGAVGRILISNSPSGKPEMLLDLKGTIYKTTIAPSRTFCIVSFGQSVAKVEAVMNDFIQLKPHSNVFESETMVEGTLEGFSFASDEEGDNALRASDHQGNQDNENGDPADSKTKKKADKSSLGTTKRKKAKTATKPTKKLAKKSTVSKKTKSGKK
ncbi:hypothetical protein AMTRI_Chr01g136840 [Amborella trichopoda]